MTLPAEKLRKYPHMMPNDILIWERFLTQFPVRFDGFDYDIRVGKGRIPAETEPQWKIDLALALTRFRIDAIGWNDGKPTIIEVKPYAGLSALGQLLGYLYFWNKEHMDNRTSRLLCVTDKSTEDVRFLFGYYNVELIEVGFE